jgi:hypothetical protein
MCRLAASSAQGRGVAAATRALRNVRARARRCEELASAACARGARLLHRGARRAHALATRGGLPPRRRGMLGERAWAVRARRRRRAIARSATSLRRCAVRLIDHAGSQLTTGIARRDLD